MNIKNLVLESIKTKIKLAHDKNLISNINKAANKINDTFSRGNKILIAGNGGSAADAQHFAAELLGQFSIKNRVSLPAIALATNTSIITAIGNDFSFEEIFSRQVEGLGRPGDIFFCISTSGNSENIVRACRVAKKKGIFIIGLLGKKGGKVKDLADISLIVPGQKTSFIQEAHIMIIHVLCQAVDEYFTKK